MHDVGLLFRALLRWPQFLWAWWRRRPADPAVVQARMATCYACPDLNLPTLQCEICSCFVKVKTQWADQTCPQNRWST